EILAKKLDPNKKEIVLLSCNDLASAQTLAQATGKKVYTTDGAITIFENGIKRADNTKWYEVSSEGTAKELSSPPVKECSTCTGEGVEMGRSFSNNLSDDVLQNLENTLGGTKLAELLEITKQLPSTWTIKRIEGKLVLVDKEGKQWAEILNNEIRATAGDAGQGWNKFLNIAPPLMKNFRYVVDNGRYVFETDELGRVNKAIMEDIDFYTRARNETYQQETKLVKDGFSGDAGGHIFRNEWGGPSEQINYFSQNAPENSYGEWYKMEKAVSDFKKLNPDVKIKAEMKFNFNGNSKRPISIDVKVFKNGKIDLSLSKIYDNP
ncbi:DNA/RNA non-specific endonuclease, partial [Flavobacterium covae]|uniref:DNA/RNA non-specific endonuclease n=1 Tax=Flavobacterium covae TaxID=2906076 RepID=UPI001FB68F4D